MSVALDVADLAAEQWGLVTSAQARELGASPQTLARLAKRGALERMSHGIYRVTGTPPSPLDDIRAAWLSLDPSRTASSRRRDELPAVVSHRSAAALHGLGDLEADELEFTASVRKQTRRADVRIHRLQLDPGEWTLLDGLPVTTITRTISDLAEARTDGGHLASVVRDAITKRQADDEQLVAALRPYAHRYGAPLGDGDEFLSRLLEESGIAEPLERAVSRATRAAAWDPDQFKRLVDHVAGLNIPTAQIELSPQLQATIAQIANSPALRTAAAAARISESAQPVLDAALRAAQLADTSQLALSPQVRDMLAHMANSPALKAAADAARITENAGPALSAALKAAQIVDTTSQVRALAAPAEDDDETGGK